MGGEFTRRGCIHHHSYRHLRLFYDYALLYKNFVEAGIVRILEAATDVEADAWLLQAESRMKRGKKVEPEPPHWITMSFEQMRSYLIVGCMGEKVSEPTFKKHLKKLMERKHILQRVNPDPNPKAQNGPRQYLLNCKLVQKELDKQQKEVDLFLQNLIAGTDEEIEDSGDELIVTATSNTPHPGVNFYPSPKDLGGGKSLGEGQHFTPGSKVDPREDTKFRGGRIQSLGEGGYKVDPPITNSNYSNITNGLHSSSPESQQNTDDSDDETQEGEEEITPLSENISQTDDDIDPTEKHSIVSRNPASSTIEPVTQASKQHSVIPARPKPATTVNQDRCNRLVLAINNWRGWPLENEGYVRKQYAIIEQLIASYSDEDIQWIQCYTAHYCERMAGMKPGPEYASILCDVAQEALQAAVPMIRSALMQHAASAADPPVAPAKPKPAQQQQQADNPYSLENLFALNNGRGLTGG